MPLLANKDFEGHGAGSPTWDSLWASPGTFLGPWPACPAWPRLGFHAPLTATLGLARQSPAVCILPPAHFLGLLIL